MAVYILGNEAAEQISEADKSGSEVHIYKAGQVGLRLQIINGTEGRVQLCRHRSNYVLINSKKGGQPLLFGNGRCSLPWTWQISIQLVTKGSQFSISVGKVTNYLLLLYPKKKLVIALFTTGLYRWIPVVSGWKWANLNMIRRWLTWNIKVVDDSLKTFTYIFIRAFCE